MGHLIPFWVSVAFRVPLLEHPHCLKHPLHLEPAQDNRAVDGAANRPQCSQDESTGPGFWPAQVVFASLVGEEDEGEGGGGRDDGLVDSPITV